MKKALALILALAMLLALPACGKKEPKQRPWLTTLYHEAAATYDASGVEAYADLPAKDSRKLDTVIWQYMVGADKYVHAYDEYYDNRGPIQSKKEDIIKITEKIDKEYPSEMDLSEYNIAHADEYIEAASRFFDATQNYSLYIVSYAQFGGTDYYDLLKKYEGLVDQYREQVIEARLHYLAATGQHIE